MKTEEFFQLCTPIHSLLRLTRLLSGCRFCRPRLVSSSAALLVCQTCQPPIQDAYDRRTEHPILVDPAWLAEHINDPDICLIEVAGLRPEDADAYRAGHVPGAHSWKWQEMLWDSYTREFPGPDGFARRMGAAGIGEKTAVVFYGEGMQFGDYAWWVFRYCGHERVCVLDGARTRWAIEGRLLTQDVPSERAVRAYRATARVENMRILRDGVIRALGAPSTLILDGRSPEEYRGERVGAPGGRESAPGRCAR